MSAARRFSTLPIPGYQRLQAADAVVIADVGAPPRWMFSREAHAGCLAFEFSSGLHRLVVNCGAPNDDSGEAREAARATAAHSTLVIDDHSSCRFASMGSKSPAAGAVLEGPSRVEVKRWLDEAGRQCIDARHDGYARSYGVLHRRILRLAGDGASLAGEDRIAPARKGAPPADKSLVVRFHLHPAVRAALDPDAGQVLLTSPSGEEWWFDGAGRPISLEESIFFAAPGGAIATTQIVLRGALAENECLNWSFARSERMDHAVAAGTADPTQPPPVTGFEILRRKAGFVSRPNRDVAPQQYKIATSLAPSHLGVFMTGDLARINRALISVSDKSGLVELGAALAARGSRLCRPAARRAR